MSSTAELKLHTNDAFKKVFKPSCTVKMDDQVDVLNDFIVVGFKEGSETPTIIQYADSMTLGHAAIATKHAFIKSLQKLDPSIREEVLTYFKEA